MRAPHINACRFLMAHRNWYHSAQEIRIVEETKEDMEVVVDDESEGEVPSLAGASSTKLEKVPEEGPAAAPAASKPKRAARTESQRAALRELYWHEMIALLSCFAFPALGAYVLHHIRSQLSRPSEGLVSNYNLSIFLLAAEIRPLSHLLKLVQSRTLHLQRVVHGLPFKEDPATSEQMADVVRRLEDLEVRAAPAESSQDGASTSPRAKQETLVREVRGAIQPDLDALNRAVRRYEKKATVLAFQTDSRLGALDMRLNDAIALAAAAAKNSTAQRTVTEWLIDSIVTVVMLPVRMAMALVLFPFRLIALLFPTKKRSGTERTSRPRTSRTTSQAKHGGDRVSSRLARR
jgi:hypothetical protein